jgi:PAS domain-containing protein
VILSSPANEEAAEQAVRRGAKDYLLQDHRAGYPLPHSLRSVIERISLEKESFAELERASVTLDSIGDAVLSVDMAGDVTYLNRVAEKMTGWSHQEARGRPLVQIFRIMDGGTRELARDPLEAAIQQNKRGFGEQLHLYPPGRAGNIHRSRHLSHLQRRRRHHRCGNRLSGGRRGPSKIARDVTYGPARPADRFA